VPLGKKTFPIKAQVDEDGEMLEDNGLVPRFRQARNGDHLMTPFQCELRHFRNIVGRDPTTISRLDSELMEYFRRANLDAFWARETTTVMHNLREAKRGARFVARLQMPPLTPEMGPFPLNDSLGMGVAAVVLDRSLDQGKHEDHVQFETF
jgi:hypothetical protein